MNPASWPPRAFDSADALGLMTESAKSRFSSHRSYREALAAEGLRVDEDGEMVHIIEEEESNKPARDYDTSIWERILGWLSFQLDRSWWGRYERDRIAKHYSVERAKSIYGG